MALSSPSTTVAISGRPLPRPARLAGMAPGASVDGRMTR
ncbi:MAG: hypothetical protein H6Q36_811 [Chloroflexi bacterium]|jgi:hypothetical protein|nr:hypothetical protein [Chloroflexota bacterium]